MSRIKLNELFLRMVKHEGNKKISVHAELLQVFLWHSGLVSRYNQLDQRADDASALVTKGF